MAEFQWIRKQQPIGPLPRRSHIGMLRARRGWATALVIGILALLLPRVSLALECPRIPEQARKDWEVEVKAAVGKIGPVAGAELQTRTRNATADLMGKLPQADKVYLEQMMYATYCSSLRDDSNLSEAEKGNRIRAYNLEVRKTLYGTPPKPPQKDGSSEGVPSSARLRLGQLSIPYTPEAFVKSAQTGDVHAVQLFLTAGMAPDAKDRSGTTALMRAAAEGHIPVIDALLKAKASVNERDPEGGTALMWSAGRSDLRILDALLKAGADVNARDRNGATALSWAAARGNRDAVRRLLAAGVNLEGVNHAFVAAARANDEPTLRLLLARGADVKKTGASALIGVVRGDNINNTVSDIVGFLLDQGADVNGSNEKGESALLLAANTGNTALVRVLLARGADVRAVCVCDGYNSARNWTALQRAAFNRHGETVDALLARGADVRHRNSRGSTPLHSATYGGSPEVVQALLASGADPNARDEDSATPLMTVGDDGVETLRLLLDRGAEINAQDDRGWTSLVHDAYWGREARLRTLLQRGADVNRRTKGGQTALIIATTRGRREIVRVLLRAGARADEKDDDGKTAVDHAEGIRDDKMRTELVRLLTQGASR